MRVVLASASPRRSALLRESGLCFEVAPAAIDEDLSLARPGAPPEEVAMGLALRKALARARLEPGEAWVLGADTIVVAPRGDLFAKPRDEEEAHRMIALLAGVPHAVVTGIAWVDAASGRALAGAVRSEVLLKRLEATAIEAYVKSGLWRDKAGGYGAQDGVLVEKIWGSASNVYGLPIEETMALLQEMGG